jgi:hypothetical protein
MIYARRPNGSKRRVKELELEYENAKTMKTNRTDIVETATPSIIETARPKDGKPQMEELAPVEASLTLQESSYAKRKSQSSSERHTRSEWSASSDTNRDDSSIALEERKEAVDDRASAERQAEQETMQQLAESTNVSMDTSCEELADILQEWVVDIIIEEKERHQDDAGSQTKRGSDTKGETGDCIDDGRDDGVSDEVWAELELSKEAERQHLLGKLERQ